MAHYTNECVVLERGKTQETIIFEIGLKLTPSVTVIFVAIETLEILENTAVNNIFWSPSGQFVVLANLKG